MFGTGRAAGIGTIRSPAQTILDTRLPKEGAQRALTALKAGIVVSCARSSHDEPPILQ
jgi:hypothetical protein